MYDDGNNKTVTISAHDAEVVARILGELRLGDCTREEFSAALSVRNALLLPAPKKCCALCGAVLRSIRISVCEDCSADDEV